MAKGETKRHPELALVLGEALTRYKVAHKIKRFSQREIGVRVAELIGSPKPIKDQRVSNWFAGQEPYFLEGVALCEVLGADPLALARAVAVRRSNGQILEMPPVIPPAARLADHVSASESAIGQGGRSRGRRRPNAPGGRG